MKTKYKIVEAICFDDYHLQAARLMFSSELNDFVKTKETDFSDKCKEALDKIEKIITHVNEHVYSHVDRLNMIITVINSLKDE